MVETKSYKQKNLTFILEPGKIVVQTGLQTFYLEPIAHYWKRRLSAIRLGIMVGEITSLQELATWCGPGVTWEITNYYIDKHKEIGILKI
jgi:hypothetical protein